MTSANEKPKPGSKSETVSAVKDAIGGAAGKAVAATAITREAFADNAEAANLYEIEAAKIALERSRRHDVKEFARQMIADHTKTSSELKSFLGQTNSPQRPRDSLDALHQTLIDDLNGASDEDFDKRYIAQQQSAHSNAITLFKTYQNAGQDDGLRSLAGLALPMLEHHMEMVRDLEKAS